MSFGNNMGSLRALILIVLATPGWISQASAQRPSDPSPIPEYTGERVYQTQVDGDYDSLRPDIARLEKESSQTYYVVVVRSTGSGKKATRAYLEQMIERWESQAARRKIAFDPKRAVVILLAIENRQVIVLGGEELQERFGFRDPYIERDLIQPHFIPYAKSKDYVRGLRVLLTQIDRWIGERDMSLARHRDESAAREAQLKQEAQSALATAKRVLEEVRKEVGESRSKGLDVGAYESRMKLAADDIEAATRRSNTSPSEALDLAQRSERSLNDELDQLQRVSARQAAVDRALQKSSALAGDVLKEVEAAFEEGLPVAPVQEELDAAKAQIELARQALKSDPGRAEALANPIDGSLHAALEHVKALPNLRRDVEQKAREIAALEGSAKAELDRAQAAGVAGKELLDDWNRASTSLATARESAGKDDRRALAAFKEAEGPLVEVRDQSQARVRAHVYYTRTVPFMILGMIIALVAAVYGALWYRKRRLQGKVGAQFKGFREKAVSLMDRLDALRQRHKALPLTDPDYTHPLAGATLVLYQDVEKTLNALWERWLRVMDVWDQAQTLVKSGSGLAVSKIEEAKKLIETEGNVDEILRECASCEQQLDRLNQAHEQARESLKSAQAKAGELKKAREAIGQVGLPTEAYSQEESTIKGLFIQAEALIVTDPIGASEAIAHSREALEAVVGRAGQVLSRFHEAQEVGKAIDELAARASQLRGQGVKLVEREADPDRGIVEARAKQESALDALKKGDPGSASKSLDEARATLDRARRGIDEHLQARDLLLKELPAMHEGVAEIRQGLERAEATLEHLRKTDAAESWADVAGNAKQARARLQSLETSLARADEDASDHVQHYLAAASSLKELARGRAEIDRLLTALADRETTLAELARRMREETAGLAAEIRQGESYFEQNRQAIGDDARRALDRSVAAHRELAGLLNQRPANWPAVERQATIVRQGLAMAMRQGGEDVEGYERVTTKLEQVRRKARDLGSMLGREEKDRLPANQRYRAALDALRAFEGGPADASDWGHLLRQLDEVEANLDRAEGLAREDVSLANGAIAEINQADRAIRSARAFYELGVSADVNNAEGELARARGALATQSYEQAVEFANAAERAASESYEAAAQEARRRRMRVESENVFNGPNTGMIIAAAQAAAAAAVAAGVLGSQQARAQDEPFASSPPEPVTGSWDAGDNRGNWTSGADQASW